MTISTGDGVEKFGAQAAITNAGVAITNGTFSLQADAIAWTNADNAPEADVLLEATFAAAPTVGAAVGIYLRKLNVRGANDEPFPALSDNEHLYVGEWVVDAGSTSLIRTKRIRLPNGKASQEYEFGLKNQGGQNISSCQAWITPVAIGPAP